MAFSCVCCDFVNIKSDEDLQVFVERQLERDRKRQKDRVLFSQEELDALEINLHKMKKYNSPSGKGRSFAFSLVGNSHEKKMSSTYVNKGGKRGGKSPLARVSSSFLEEKKEVKSSKKQNSSNKLSKFGSFLN
jgi:hypothetical protein